MNNDFIMIQFYKHGNQVGFSEKLLQEMKIPMKNEFYFEDRIQDTVEKFLKSK